jgi:hypothetical protein
MSGMMYFAINYSYLLKILRICALLLYNIILQSLRVFCVVLTFLAVLL